MKTIQDIKGTLKDHKKELKKKYGISIIGIFGSYIKNQQDETSDVDILVEFENAIDLLTFVNLKDYLSDLLHMKVDLVMKKGLKPEIGKRILKEVILV